MRGASAATRYSNKLQSMSEGLGIELLLLVPHLMIEKILFFIRHRQWDRCYKDLQNEYC